MKVIVSDKLAEEGVNILKEAGFSVDCKYKLTPDELKKIIGDLLNITNILINILKLSPDSLISCLISCK